MTCEVWRWHPRGRRRSTVRHSGWSKTRVEHRVNRGWYKTRIEYRVIDGGHRVIWAIRVIRAIGTIRVIRVIGP